MEAIEETESSWQSLVQKWKKKDFVINPHMLRREMGADSGGWRADLRGSAFNGIFRHDTPVMFNPCINKHIWNCLIILCKAKRSRNIMKVCFWAQCGMCVWPRCPFFLHIVFLNDLGFSDGVEYWKIRFAWTQLNVLDFTWAPTNESQSSLQSVSYISLSHTLEFNKCLFLLYTIFTAFSFSHFINKTCGSAFKWHSSHSYQHNTAPWIITTVFHRIQRERKHLRLDIVDASCIMYAGYEDWQNSNNGCRMDISHNKIQLSISITIVFAIIYKLMTYNSSVWILI